MSKLNLIGQQFGRLTVVNEEIPRNGRRRWKCLCQCGNEKIAAQGDLTSQHTMSCGCLLTETRVRNTAKFYQPVHGLSRTPIYKTWWRMMQRCYNPKYKHFAQYGGRGIAVHQPWHDVTVFASEMGDPPPDAPELDRIDNDKGYEPGNVRWATRLQQMRNQRRTIMVAFRGETRPLREWAEITKIPFDTLYQRLFKMKWDAERALSQPLGPTSVRYK